MREKELLSSLIVIVNIEHKMFHIIKGVGEGRKRRSNKKEINLSA